MKSEVSQDERLGWRAASDWKGWDSELNLFTSFTIYQKYSYTIRLREYIDATNLKTYKTLKAYVELCAALYHDKERKNIENVKDRKLNWRWFVIF